jgi:hypothetical protein
MGSKTRPLTSDPKFSVFLKTKPPGFGFFYKKKKRILGYLLNSHKAFLFFLTKLPHFSLPFFFSK